ncbi:integrin alpha-5-like isoform X1 [Engraulis encrasicolus]|uniref:integrin alpha-5-like isoform X1 n=2 Tax=Engraulis encrasicolus TaxID=184585 RepID=UPI002FCF3F33
MSQLYNRPRAMGSTRISRRDSATSPSPTGFPKFRLCAHFIVWIAALASACTGFNLDVKERVVYTGPEGSYFGYSVEFYDDNSSSVSILVGAPKANTSQPDVMEGGAVFLCPWSRSQSKCSILEFDSEGDRSFNINDKDLKVEFKSHQWFGATVRSHGDTVLACAPRYYWRTEHDIPFSDATGTCYLSVNNFTKIVEYAPCRTERHGPAGQGYCQGGFSADFTQDGKVVLGGPGSFYWQGQLITATTEEIVKAFYPSYFLLSVDGQVQTRQVQSSYDDSYLGYSVTVGEFSGDDTEDFVTGVPKGVMLYGLVSILNGTNLQSMLNFTGEQMGSYFGYAVATTDINNDGLMDLVVGAPLFMFHWPGGHLEEVGRVYVYLQTAPLLFRPAQQLSGTHTYGRFGASFAPLGDLDQDGYNDVAIGCPFGGEEGHGLVLIYNGQTTGLGDTPSQVLAAHWASGRLPTGFGFSIQGNKDLDGNGYPDLLVGAFGVDKAVLYRARPIVNTTATLTIHPTMINPEERNCIVTNENGTSPASCVSLSYCLSAEGKHLPADLAFVVEVQLDNKKHQLQQQQRGLVRRALFLDSQQPSLLQTLSIANGARICLESKIYLRGEKEFRDKLSPIVISLNYSLDPRAPVDQHGLQPILNYQSSQLIEQKTQIQLDCGDDNICVPDLKLTVQGDRDEVYLGDENVLTLAFNAVNDGEGGAYEADLYVLLPPEADYSGIARNNQTLSQLTCSYTSVNDTRFVSCDLGNPMKSGTSLWAGLRFTVPRVKDTQKTVQFDLQIRSKNENNSHSEVVSYPLNVAVMADVILQGVSRPDKLLFPPADWRPTNRWIEQDIGPQMLHVYELVNNGPSTLSVSTLELRCPRQVEGHGLVYPLEVSTEGPLNCTTKNIINPLRVKLQPSPSEEPPSLASTGPSPPRQSRELPRDQLSQLSNLSCWTVQCWRLQCSVGLLPRGKSAILKVRSRVNAETFIERAYKQYTLECTMEYKVEKMPYSILPKEHPSGSTKVVTPIVWGNPENPYAVPLWIIILAILAGLLLLALLIYILYKLGFFKRSDPYGTAMEKAKLKPQASSEA